ncbi:sugar ABC transporter permease [Synechocystis sp. LKSZ1]|uniref:carbohydrate ABC transporter permease n=1 Tax=Synechocystis sp. LKSZ1 TaxID=3144951 RepID=UPI00336BEEAD
MPSLPRLNGVVLLLPALFLLGLVFIYPIAWALGLSFFRQNLATQLSPLFTGLANWERLLGDGRFWQSLSNTFIFSSISVGLELLLGLGIALLLNQNFRGRGLVRTVAILPWALPTAIMGLAWAWIFNDQYGIVNDLLQRLHLRETGLTWLGEPHLAMAALIVADVWKTTPFMAIILLAGLQAIPQDLYEAYALDGARAWQSFWRLTLPLLRPQIFLALLFRFAQAFGVFDLIQVMTGGGPAGSTETISVYIYATVMRYLDFGYGATLVTATFLLLIGIVATMVGLIGLRNRPSKA